MTALDNFNEYTVLSSTCGVRYLYPSVASVKFIAKADGEREEPLQVEADEFRLSAGDFTRAALGVACSSKGPSTSWVAMDSSFPVL